MVTLPPELMVISVAVEVSLIKNWLLLLRVKVQLLPPVLELSIRQLVEPLLVVRIMVRVAVEEFSVICKPVEPSPASIVVKPAMVVTPLIAVTPFTVVSPSRRLVPFTWSFSSGDASPMPTLPSGSMKIELLGAPGLILRGRVLPLVTSRTKKLVSLPATSQV